MINEVKIFKALSDKTRLKILNFLKDGEKCVCEIVPITGKSQPNVSQHLKILTEAGILEFRKEGTSVYYRISDEKYINLLEILSEKVKLTKIEKKPVEKIETESARNVIINQHKKFGKTISVDGCFGSSNIGQMSGFIPREIVRKIPNAFMRCPLALFPDVEGPTQVLLYDDYHVVIDGCKARCLAKTYKKAGIKVDLSYALDEDFGCEKLPGPDFDEEKMKEIAEKIIKDIKEKILAEK